MLPCFYVFFSLFLIHDDPYDYYNYISRSITIWDRHDIYVPYIWKLLLLLLKIIIIIIIITNSSSSSSRSSKSSMNSRTVK